MNGDFFGSGFWGNKKFLYLGSVVHLRRNTVGWPHPVEITYRLVQRQVDPNFGGDSLANERRMAFSRRNHVQLGTKPSGLMDLGARRMATTRRNCASLGTTMPSGHHDIYS